MTTSGSHQTVISENREYWEAIAGGRPGAPVEFFQNGGNALEPCEMDATGDPKGLRVLHLACSVGDESLSLAMLGARSTGVELSPTHVARARAKAAELGLDVDFREGDMTALDTDLTGFDLVYISGGGICWVPDIGVWALDMAARLAGGGRVLICEHHPLWESLSVVGENHLTVTWDYFGGARVGYPDPRKGPQVTHDRSELLPTNTSFVWSLGAVISALIDAGLRIQRLQEFAEPDMYDGLGAQASCVPATYLVLAQKP